MKMMKRALGILLSCLMLMSLLSVGVFAADPIDAETKWFGYGVNTYLLNPTIAAGNADGISYSLTAKKAGVLFVEHSYKNVDYTVTVTVNGMTYEGGCIDGVPYNRPVHTYHINKGDVALVQIVTRDAAGGTVYASMNVITADASDAIKVKSTNYPIYVAAGQTVYFQDDSLQAEYATKAVTLSGDSVKDVVFYNVVNNATTGVTTTKPFTDTDGDNTIEVKLGGSAGGAGTPAVKPAWAVENNSNKDKCFILTLTPNAHECEYDDNTDLECNSCGAVRELPTCEHDYDNACDTDCNECGEPREVEDHQYSDACDADCNECGETREAPHNPVQNDCQMQCCVCLEILEQLDTGHTYGYACDTDCLTCQQTTRPEAKHIYHYDCSTDCVECGATTRPEAVHVYIYDCSVDCATCGETTRPEAEHLYDNACDTDCAYCGNVRSVGGHVYDNTCDASCNECGDVRTSILHTYTDDCDAECDVCGEGRVAPHYPVGENCGYMCCVCLKNLSSIEHTYSGVCDNYCNVCDTYRETIGHTYDNDCDTDCNVCSDQREVEDHWDNDGNALCDSCNLPLEIDFGIITFSNFSASPDVLGLSFRFSMDVAGMDVVENTAVAVYTNATVSHNDNTFALKTMGTVITNQPVEVLDLTTVNDFTIKKVTAYYLYEVSEDAAAYAVRVINIPPTHTDTVISARPYYIFADDNGVEYIAYGDIYANSYNGVLADYAAN